MTTLTVELPPDLDAWLETVSGGDAGEKAEMIRQALRTFRDARGGSGDHSTELQPAREGEITPEALGTKGPRRKPTPGSALERAGDIVGSVEGPGDLSYNPKYMEGFGR